MFMVKSFIYATLIRFIIKITIITGIEHILFTVYIYTGTQGLVRLLKLMFIIIKQHKPFV